MLNLFTWSYGSGKSQSWPDLDKKELKELSPQSLSRDFFLARYWTQECSFLNISLNSQCACETYLGREYTGELLKFHIKPTPLTPHSFLLLENNQGLWYQSFNPHSLPALNPEKSVSVKSYYNVHVADVYGDCQWIVKPPNFCAGQQNMEKKIIFSSKPLFPMLSKHQLLCHLTLPSW